MAAISRTPSGWLLSRCLAVLILGLFSTAQAAEPAPQPPAGLSQAQFDSLVDAISKAVAARLKEGGRGQLTDGAPALTEAAAPDREPGPSIPAFSARARAILSAYPDLSREIARIPSLLDQGEEGRSPGNFAALLALAASAALAAEALVRYALLGVRRRLAARIAADHDRVGLGSLIGLAVIDAIAVGAVWLVGYGAVAIWFSGTGAQSQLAMLVLAGILTWRLYMLAFRLVLRPDLPDARLAVMPDRDARALYGSITAVVLAIVAARSLTRVLIAIGSPPEAIAAEQIAANLFLLAILITLVAASREAVAGWFASLARPAGPSIGRLAARYWHGLAILFFGFLVAAAIYGAIMERYTVPRALILTLSVILALIFLQTVIVFLLRRPAGSGDASLPLASSGPRLGGLVARCLTVAALIGAAVLVTQFWIVDVLALVDSGDWARLTHASLTTGMTLFAAYVAWEAILFATARYGVVNSGSAGGSGEEKQAGGSSRLATLMPLLRVFASIAILVIALLIVLSDLGVNITPLIAGASVFGLAISFGSQTLVRDIVSGIFYLADDAFRVGEYIDCGKAKGTVEGFTLRSIKLRHQNGQLHTIPFGQLGQITNFSRDWTTVKFNFRFARKTDLEKLRKTVKAIGQDMLEDPELKGNFLEPLKMQGVTDITDNALVVRFKFTVKPMNPSLVQRQAIKRMVAAFAANGIEFADATVAVQTLGAALDTPAAGASAASSRLRDVASG
ncbi:mechanosensitive ion channel family protein [Microvirga sp. Mcv34]|uniref:mechanosensitive ion channel family protein n=1 Tax=Microvirga sp. Mcv34 TaxID=2926016 RepID=UPI0021C9924B|nr:mechanosensitive ion channel family protein [Microvirga sp. Mcv34]